MLLIRRRCFSNEVRANEARRAAALQMQQQTGKLGCKPDWNWAATEMGCKPGLKCGLQTGTEGGLQTGTEGGLQTTESAAKSTGTGLQTGTGTGLQTGKVAKPTELGRQATELATLAVTQSSGGISTIPEIPPAWVALVTELWLYTSGQRRANIRRAEQQLRFDQLDVEREIEQLRVDVANEYFMIWSSRRSVRINSSAVRNAQASLRDAQSFRTSWGGTRFDAYNFAAMMKPKDRLIPESAANFASPVSDSLKPGPVSFNLQPQTLWK